MHAHALCQLRHVLFSLFVCLKRYFITSEKTFHRKRKGTSLQTKRYFVASSELLRSLRDSSPHRAQRRCRPSAKPSPTMREAFALWSAKPLRLLRNAFALHRQRRCPVSGAIRLSVFCQFLANVGRKMQKSANLFCSSRGYSYLCTRFPRNRWQEVASCLLCCVGTIQQTNVIKN